MTLTNIQIICSVFTLFSCLALILSIHGTADMRTIWIWRTACCIVTAAVIWFGYYPILAMIIDNGAN